MDTLAYLMKSYAGTITFRGALRENERSISYDGYNFEILRWYRRPIRISCLAACANAS